MDGWMGGWMDGRVDGCLDGWVGGWWMGGWMDGWAGGWMGGNLVETAVRPNYFKLYKLVSKPWPPVTSCQQSHASVPSVTPHDTCVAIILPPVPFSRACHFRYVVTSNLVGDFNRYKIDVWLLVCSFYCAGGVMVGVDVRASWFGKEGYDFEVLCCLLYRTVPRAFYSLLC